MHPMTEAPTAAASRPAYVHGSTATAGNEANWSPEHAGKSMGGGMHTAVPALAPPAPLTLSRSALASTLSLYSTAGVAVPHPNPIRCQLEAVMWLLREFGTESVCAELTGVRWAPREEDDHPKVDRSKVTQAIGAFRDGTALHRMLNDICRVIFNMKRRSSKTMKLYLRWTGSSRHVSARGDPTLGVQLGVGSSVFNVSEFTEGVPGAFRASFLALSTSHPSFEGKTRVYLRHRLQAHVQERSTPPGTHHAPTDVYSESPPLSPPSIESYAMESAKAAVLPLSAKKRVKEDAKPKPKPRGAVKRARPSSYAAPVLSEHSDMEGSMTGSMGGSMAGSMANVDNKANDWHGQHLQQQQQQQQEDIAAWGTPSNINYYPMEGFDCLPLPDDTFGLLPAFPDDTEEDTHVKGDLRVDGDALKPGSPLWTVFSDKRLKKDVRRFRLGTDTILGIVPVCFRYNGLGDVPADDTVYVGVIAQELPLELVEFCRHKVLVRLRPSDKKMVDVFVVDHSCLQFVLVNAVQELHHNQHSTAEQVRSLHETQECAAAQVGEVADVVEYCRNQVLSMRQQIDHLHASNLASNDELQALASIGKSTQDVLEDLPFGHHHRGLSMTQDAGMQPGFAPSVVLGNTIGLGYNDLCGCSEEPVSCLLFCVCPCWLFGLTHRVAGTRKSTVGGCLVFSVPIIITWIIYIAWTWYMCTSCYDDSGHISEEHISACLSFSGPVHDFFDDGECTSGGGYSSDGSKASLATCIAREECLHDNTPAGMACYAKPRREYERFPPFSSVVHEAMWPVPASAAKCEQQGNIHVAYNCAQLTAVLHLASNGTFDDIKDTYTFRTTGGARGVRNPNNYRLGDSDEAHDLIKLIKAQAVNASDAYGDDSNIAVYVHLTERYTPDYLCEHFTERCCPAPTSKVQRLAAEHYAEEEQHEHFTRKIHFCTKIALRLFIGLYLTVLVGFYRGKLQTHFGDPVTTRMNYLLALACLPCLLTQEARFVVARQQRTPLSLLRTRNPVSPVTPVQAIAVALEEMPRPTMGRVAVVREDIDAGVAMGVIVSLSDDDELENV